MPPVPVTPPSKAGKVAGRSSLTTQAEAAARDARIVELRSANVPIRQISKMLGVPEKRVRKSIENHFKANAEWAAANTLLLKWEKRHQFEMLDSLVLQSVLSFEPAVITGAKAPPAGTAPTISYRDWLGGIETSRRIKGDLVRLHGLDGVSPVKTDADGQAVRPDDEWFKEKAVSEFLNDLSAERPDLYEMIAATFKRKAPEPAPDLPLPNGEPMPAEDDDDQSP